MLGICLGIRIENQRDETTHRVLVAFIYHHKGFVFVCTPIPLAIAVGMDLPPPVPKA